MILSPDELRHILAHMTGAEGRMRPGTWTALMKIALVEKIEKMIKDGEE